MTMIGKASNTPVSRMRGVLARDGLTQPGADEQRQLRLCRWMWLVRHVLVAVILGAGIADGGVGRADALVIGMAVLGVVSNTLSVTRRDIAGWVTLADVILLSAFAAAGLPATAVLTVAVVMLAWGATFRPLVAAGTFLGVTAAVVLTYTVGDRPPAWLSALAFCAATAILTVRAIRLNISARTLGEHEHRLSRHIDAVLWEQIPGRGLRVTPAAERIFGYPAERWEDPGFVASIRHPDDPCMVADLQSGDVAPVVMFRIRHADGGWRSCEAHVTAVTDASGRHRFFTGVLVDRTRQVAVESEAATLGRVVMTSPVPQMLLRRSDDGQWRVVSVNHACSAMLDESVVVRRRLGEIGRDHACLARAAELLDGDAEPGAITTEVTEADGRVIQVGVRAVDPTSCTVDFMDVTDRVRASHLLYEQARRDELTGLPNRRALAEHLAGRLGDPDSGPVALLSIDLDAFKEINDALGHETGDQLLVQLARRIVACRPSGQGCACRIGGDEFAVVLAGSTGEGARAVAARISEEISQPVHVGELRLRVRASIGIAAAPADAETVDELIRRADVAMHRAKDDGGGVQVYEPQIDPLATGRLALVGDLETVLSTGTLDLHHQPLIDVATGRIVGSEALARWRHPTVGMISPTVFVGLAEGSDQIRPLTRWVIRRALTDLREIGRIDPDFTVSVNLSVRNLYEADLVSWVRDAMAEHGIGPGRLIVEITEGSVMDDHAAAIETLEGLRAIGVESWIDDFGTGHSSFARLRHLPVDGVKIDRSFVAEATTERERVVLRSMIELVHSLGLRVIVEGVETASVLTMLGTFGADRAQGYHVGRPEPMDRLARRIAHLGIAV